MENQFTIAAFSNYLNEHRLMGSRDIKTGDVYLPPRSINPANFSTEMEWFEFSGKGTLMAFTNILSGSTAMIAAGYDRKNPYTTGIVKTAEGIIINAKRRAEVCVLFYPPYYATELERPSGGQCGLQFIPSAIRRPAYFDGLLKVLQILNIDYDMADLSKSSAGSLGMYKQVWAFCTDEMNAAEQHTIVDYVRAGGNAVIFPYLPDREMSQKPCTVIRDALSVSPAGKETIDSPLIDIFNHRDIKCANPQIVYS
jgi:uncharacterized OB-fold protein